VLLAKLVVIGELVVKVVDGGAMLVYLVLGETVEEDAGVLAVEETEDTIEVDVIEADTMIEDEVDTITEEVEAEAASILNGKDHWKVLTSESRAIWIP
jgi:hypothetical protein